MDIVTRAEWGARKPRGRQTVAWKDRTGFMIHYSAASPTQTPRQIQDYHMDHNGWEDIGYNMLVNSITGVIYEGRGWNILGAHCLNYNTPNIGVCVIGKDTARKDVSDAARASVVWLYGEAQRRKGGKLKLLGHKDRRATSCPGNELYSWLKAGLPLVGQPAPAPAPKPPAGSRPAPGPFVAFPLPHGYYFGPAAGPDWSVSGKYNRVFKGHTDRHWLKTWANQLAKRGWSIGKGRRWLPRYGNDGIYGNEYADLARAFQKDQHLHVDALIGINTWTAAYRNPVT